MKRPPKLVIVGATMVLAVGVISVSVALAAGDPSDSPPPADSAAVQQFANSDFVPTSDQNGNTVGYVKGPGNPSLVVSDDPDSVAEVYKNADGSGGIVGYVADFGFIDKATYDAPGFDLDAKRAQVRSEIEAEARKTDPNFSLDQAEQEMRDRATNPSLMTPTTTTP